MSNLIVIALFIAMFKRRHQAFSYLILWNFQVFLNGFFKLVMRQGRPAMVIPSQTSSSGVEIPWTSGVDIISLGSPSGTSLFAMCIALSVVMEHIYHTEEQSEHDNIRLTLTESRMDLSASHLQTRSVS